MSNKKSAQPTITKLQAVRSIHYFCLWRCCRNDEYEVHWCETNGCPLFMYRLRHWAREATLSELKKAVKRFCARGAVCGSSPTECYKIPCPLSHFLRVTTNVKRRGEK